ncbi:hypothetical protein CSAL01_07931 [Colletotrichum salicis]|uniref:Uncharacterized protein n=1 Tax=Colletotrichum salicis TaxID=1209931 RepID=A0A135T673_9PEZI|nr:hypothetical protein CSAL01_07931 [Colletotrichum salicis]
MPPHEPLRSTLVPRVLGNFDGVTCPGAKRLVIGLVVVSVICFLAIYFAVHFRIYLARDKRTFRSLAMDLEELQKVYKTLKNQHEFIREDSRNLQMMLDFYIKEYGMHPRHNQLRFEPGHKQQASGVTDAGGPSAQGSVQEDEDIFVVQRPSEESVRGGGEESGIPADGDRVPRYSEKQKKKAKPPRIEAIAAGMQDVPLTPPVQGQVPR